MIFTSIKKKIKVSLIVGLLAYLPIQANAWGTIGHRVVGEIADSYLKTKTRKAVQDILGYETLAMCANWGDFIKSDSSYNYMYNWHFVNFPAGLNKEGVFNILETEKSPNIYNKIIDLTAVLKKSSSTMTEKRLALRMLVHLAGDLCQPMHVARKDDMGGNRVSVMWFNEKSNLHRVWDEQLIGYQQLSYTEYAKAINHPSAIEFSNWQNTSLKDCIYESYQVCNKIYDNTKPDSKLGYRYNFEWVDTLNQQLLKGGVRLAKMLNDIYG
ncbi:S1/P1 Nuclease [Pedobacter changchengzhani]|uniref:S1/P1 Nuclease n=1 Tax=Pedobacter changchengzhani TaxID=2529274 RepID=A0A4R5MPD3_9SPHI|nr:S1/P1 nuclease [Pedobacter changchengzhani]TDG37644.1 S1/P1 Nuclease [Pedobacter changchengzhani]